MVSLFIELGQLFRKTLRDMDRPLDLGIRKMRTK